MNKKLLALAIVSAASLPAIAAAEGPTVYGMIDLSVENQDLDTGAAATSSEVWAMDSNASRVGLKGDLELNDGLTGIYQVEASVKADDGVGGLGGTLRDTYAGVKGDFGTLKLGNLDTPLKKAQGVVDVFNDDVQLDMGSHVAGENREANSIYYSSPSFSGLTVNLAIMPGETAAADGLAESASASVVYDNEGAYAALAMDSEVAGNLGGSFLGTAAAVDAVRAVGAYSTDEFMVGLMFQTAEDANGTAESESVVLSGSYTMDAVTLKATYEMTELDLGAVDPEATLIGIGVDYALGKRSIAYAQLGNVEIEIGAATVEYNEIGFGLQHKF